MIFFPFFHTIMSLLLSRSSWRSERGAAAVNHGTRHGDASSCGTSIFVNTLPPQQSHSELHSSTKALLFFSSDTMRLRFCAVRNWWSCCCWSCSSRECVNLRRRSTTTHAQPATYTARVERQRKTNGKKYIHSPVRGAALLFDRSRSEEARVYSVRFSAARKERCDAFS